PPLADLGVMVGTNADGVRIKATTTPRSARLARREQLDDRTGTGRHHRADPEAGPLGQLAELLERTIPAADVAEHPQVSRGVRRGSGGVLQNEHPSGVR